MLSASSAYSSRAILLVVVTFLAACTGGKEGAGGGITPNPILDTPIADAPAVDVPPASNPTPPAVEFTTPAAAESKIVEIQQQLNTDAQYSIVEDDMALLEAEGLLDSNDNFSGWVK